MECAVNSTPHNIFLSQSLEITAKGCYANINYYAILIVKQLVAE
jgi:hypothetical protein